MTNAAFRKLTPTPDERLAELGLRLAVLDRAIAAGIDARAASPPFGPTNAPGLLDWIHRVGTLRQLLAVEGWQRLDHWNAGLVRHPSRPILLGTLQGNPFPDATPAFFRDFLDVVNRAVEGKVRLQLPFAGLPKAAVMRLGQGLPLAHTFSCIQPIAGLHCGHCNKCAERRQAFAAAGMSDPTTYHAHLNMP